MELKTDLDSDLDDECEFKFECLKTGMEIFYENFNKFMSDNENGVDIRQKSMENIEIIINSLSLKFSQLELELEKKPCVNHKNLPSDIKTFHSTFLRQTIMYHKKKSEINLSTKKTPKYSEEINTDEVNQVFSDEYFVQNTQYIYQENYLQNQILDNEHKEYEDDKEFSKEIIEVKNQIANLTKLIQSENIKASQTILEIESNVNEYDRSVEKCNENLRQAALARNNKHKLTYPLTLGTVLGVAGSFCPGVGNIIGASVGLGIGYAVAKLERKAIKKIEPEKYK
jgi:hypothetical protein